MRFILGLLFVAGAAALTTPASACGPEVRIRFIEMSPDQFRILFVRGPKAELVSLKIDLTRSAAGVVFDDYDPAALQGPQPNAQGVSVRSVGYRADNRETVTVTFEGFTEKRSANLHSDLDDNGRAADQHQNRIYDGELEGASAHATLITSEGRPIEIEGAFDKENKAVLGSRACV